MKNKILLIVLVLILVTIGLIIIYKSEKQTQGIEKQDLIISEFSVQGSLSATYLFEDKTFLTINELSPISGSEEPQCYEGKISSEGYSSFIDFVESKDFFDTKIIQEDDLGLLCKGTSSVTINIEGKSNSLRPPCVGEYTESTKEAILIMDKISEELSRITNISKEVCEKGRYIIALNQYGCSPIGKIEYELYSFSDLSPALKKSLTYEGAYVYVGPIDKTIESYHRKYYKVGDTCYYFLLLEFDGKSFISYDLVLRNKNGH